MCGIAGALAFGLRAQDWEGQLQTMASRLAHRGPDDAGYWYDNEVGVGFCNRRLAVLDLSPTGHQPMRSSSGRYIVTYNGELYNFREIRSVLERRGQPFRGSSDTEVLLAAVEEWGLSESLAKLVGMYAFALWDRSERVLYLVRDRMGEKPLYYGWQGNAFLFGSELKALSANPQWKGQIDRQSLALFLQHKYVPGPYSIYKGIKKLPPGNLMALTQAQARSRDMPEPRAYWSLKRVAEAGQSDAFPGSKDDAVDEFDRVLSDAVHGQMVADVPVGVFLSGGVDSSAIAALMQSHSNRPIKTFTIGFSEPGYNEANCAKQVARCLGTSHTEMYVTPEETLEVIPQLPEIYDEPFADPSQIPTFLISQLARSQVTVSLSGDGGDELLGGYKRYELARSLWRAMEHVPAGLRRAVSRTLVAAPTGVMDVLFEPVASLSGRYGRRGKMGHKLHRLAGLLTAENSAVLYQRLMSHRPGRSPIVRGVSAEPPSTLTDSANWPRLNDFVQQMMCVDAITYLPGDILVKLDRAAMAVSLETRVPLLDHRVVEFLLRLPQSLRVRRGTSKWILRRVLDRYLPRALVDRPKHGFGVPLDQWLRDPLREWAEDLLSPHLIAQQGFLESAPVAQRWNEHKSATHNWQSFIWNVLMFQAWHANQLSETRDRFPASSTFRGRPNAGPPQS